MCPRLLHDELLKTFETTRVANYEKLIASGAQLNMKQDATSKLEKINNELKEKIYKYHETTGSQGGEQLSIV